MLKKIAACFGKIAAELTIFYGNLKYVLVFRAIQIIGDTF